MTIIDAPTTTPLVQAEDLLARPAANRLYVDVRLGDPDKELASYRDCHIFGAVHAQIRAVFAAAPTAASGNLPLPDIAVLQGTLEGWGVDEHTEIILYGPSPAVAARGWWVLRWAGLTRVRLLDGGLKAWSAAGGAVARGDAAPRPATPPGTLALAAGHMPSIEAAEVEHLGHAVALVDARDEAAYLAGHIGRARNLPAAAQWTPAGKLRSRAALARLYAEAGIAPGSDAVVYCGGGVLSALTAMTMAEAGIAARLYVGSWSEWSKSPQRLARAATGSAA
ncbi:sulfurtransferase [Cupriavidus sp. 30B13]|uniref:sulfurtransferase n=1 Tax=Cupriavidus sp. 30B13 TaxID=3384241 RepID=UPI003B921C21